MEKPYDAAKATTGKDRQALEKDLELLEPDEAEKVREAGRTGGSYTPEYRAPKEILTSLDVDKALICMIILVEKLEAYLVHHDHEDSEAIHELANILT
jgi:hypothetical protein